MLVGFSFLSDLCFWDTNTDFFVCEKNRRIVLNWCCWEMSEIQAQKIEPEASISFKSHQVEIVMGPSLNPGSGLSRGFSLFMLQSLSTTGLSSSKLRPLQGLSLSLSRDHLYRARAISKVRIDCLYTWVHTISAWMLNGLRYLKDIRVQGTTD